VRNNKVYLFRAKICVFLEVSQRKEFLKWGIYFLITMNLLSKAIDHFRVTLSSVYKNQIVQDHMICDLGVISKLRHYLSICQLKQLYSNIMADMRHEHHMISHKLKGRGPLNVTCPYSLGGRLYSTQKVTLTVFKHLAWLDCWFVN